MSGMNKEKLYYSLPHAVFIKKIVKKRNLLALLQRFVLRCIFRNVTEVQVDNGEVN